MPSNPLRKILERRGGAEGRSSEDALEQLQRGIQESRSSVMQQNAKLARDYFEGSVEALRRQVGESRATLEGLPEQVPGGEEDEFRTLVGELMEDYDRIEKALQEAAESAADVPADEPDVSQASDDADDASEDEETEEAAPEGADPDEPVEIGEEEPVEGVAQGLVGVAEQTVDGADDAVPRASDAARRRAEELGVDLSEIEGTGVGGAITVRDVTSLAETSEAEAEGPYGPDAEDAVGLPDDIAGEAVDVLDDVASEDGEPAEQAEVDLVEDAVPGAEPDAGEGGEADGAPKATNAARRRAEELGVDLRSITGSGAGGLITIQDVVKL